MKFVKFLFLFIGTLGLIASVYIIFIGKASSDTIFGIAGSVFLIGFAITIEKHITRLPGGGIFKNDTDPTI